MNLLQLLQHELATAAPTHPALAVAQKAVSAFAAQKADSTTADDAQAFAEALWSAIGHLLPVSPAVEVIQLATPYIGNVTHWLAIEGAELCATPDDGKAVELPPNSPLPPKL